MLELTEIPARIIAAPMAGGGSTPELVAAATRAGGLGFLAAGYQSAAALSAQIAAARRLAAEPFGVNLFVPDAANTALSTSDQNEPADLSAYRAELAAEARRYGVELPATDPSDTDAWADKLDLLLADPVPVVSFTFGIPAAEVFAALHAAGTHVTVTVTDPDE